MTERENNSSRLAEFVAAQDLVYPDVVRELTAGRKQSCWMWFIFPQMVGLGSSAMSQKFGIRSAAEARSYFDHPVLGPRLKACTNLVLNCSDASIESILGYPNDLKFHSSMTLFAAVAPEEPLFARALDQFFGGERDRQTLQILAAQSDAKS